MPPQTIDEVIVHLDAVILRARTGRSRLGYFAMLYPNVTIQVKQGIAAGLFEDGARMERLDVTFANRYLAALESFRRGEPLSKCWLNCFQIANKWPPIILQHLLTGMNAHINFDLGIAAQAVAPGGELPSLEHDFNQINAILGSMIVKVRSNVEEVSPWIRFLDTLCPSTVRVLIFSTTSPLTAVSTMLKFVIPPGAPESCRVAVVEPGLRTVCDVSMVPPARLTRSKIENPGCSKQLLLNSLG